jgi:sugar phosphate isomerase/epimerase
MRLSITSDAISLDINTALEFLQEINCREFELRKLGLDNFSSADERWLDMAEKAIHQKRFRVTALAPEFFLYNQPTPDAVERLFELSKRFSCNTITIHGCNTDNFASNSEDDEEMEETGAPAGVVSALRNFVNTAQSHGCHVWLKTHEDTFAATAEEALSIIKAVGLPEKAFGLDWDVAACFAAGDDSGLDGIESVLPVLQAVHIRDAVRRGLGADAVSMGKGVIPWEDIFEQLYEEGYRGPMIVEPGVAPKLKESRNAMLLTARWIEASRMRPRK